MKDQCRARYFVMSLVLLQLLCAMVVLLEGGMLTPLFSSLKLTLQVSSESGWMRTRKDRPLILGYTAYYALKNLSGFEWRFTSCGCDYTVNKSELHKADAILFFGHNLVANDLPNNTGSHQIKMLYVRESPGRILNFYHGWNEIPMNYFDTVISYHQKTPYNSDYGRLRPITSSTQKRWNKSEVDAAIQKKRFPVFMLSSHCNPPSHRDEIAKRLEDSINVTRLGGCRAQSCDNDCEIEAIESHYFYLAFENTICEDYITEKFFRNTRLVVPIVLKRSIVSEWYAPEGSFIAVDDFCSLEELAKYLKFLIEYPSAYRRYFDWTKHYQKDMTLLENLCDFCNDLRLGKTVKADFASYTNVQSYFPTSQCNNSYGQYLAERKC